MRLVGGFEFEKMGVTTLNMLFSVIWNFMSPW